MSLHFDYDVNDPDTIKLFEDVKNIGHKAIDELEVLANDANKNIMFVLGMYIDALNATYNTVISNHLDNKLDIAKEIIKNNIGAGECGLFFSPPNIAGDHMDTLYDNDGLTISICYVWSYFEVFGLDDDEEDELEKFYDDLVTARRATYNNESN